MSGPRVAAAVGLLLGLVLLLGASSVVAQPLPHHAPDTAPNRELVVEWRQVRIRALE